MEDKIKFDPGIFRPFKPFLFANQMPIGVYPIIIKNFNLVDGVVQPVPNTNASWKGFGRHIVFEAFLEAMCEIDFVELLTFFEVVYKSSSDKMAVLLHLTEIMNYGCRGIQDKTTLIEWDYCYWVGLEQMDLKGRIGECKRWIAEKRRIKEPKIDKDKADPSLLELFNNDNKLLNGVTQILEARRFLINGRFNKDEFSPGAVRALLKVLTKELRLASFDPHSEKVGSVINSSFGYIMEPRNYKSVGKKDEDYEKEMLSWFEGFNK